VAAEPANASVEEGAGVPDDVLTPANVDDVTGRPSRPMTTGESPCVVGAALFAAEESVANDSAATNGVPVTAPETTGTDRISAVRTVLTRAPRARRAPRRRDRGRRVRTARCRNRSHRADGGAGAGR
jgi:hypothetical protein